MHRHEVRTPLNAIVGFAQIVARSEDPSFNKYSEIITANSYDLLKIIDDVMQLANHDTGLQLEKKEISVNALCEQAFLQRYGQCDCHASCRILASPLPRR